MTKELAIKMRDALKAGKNIPLRIMAMDGPVVIIDEATAFCYTKWDDANGILYHWRLVNPNDHVQAGSNQVQAVNTVAIPYEYIGVIQAITPLEMLDDQFTGIENSGATAFKENFKETIKNTFKEAMHPDRWRLSPSDINAIHGTAILSDKDNYYQGKLSEPFKETRPKAELNKWVDNKIANDEDPTADKVPVNTRVTPPVNVEP